MTAQPLTEEELAKSATEFADDAVNWLNELPDRTSPDDWPEACLVTGEELHAYLVEQFTATLSAQAQELAMLPGGVTHLDEPKLRTLAATRPADGQASVFFAAAVLQVFDLLTANRLKGVAPDRVRVVLTDG